jgi:hypothetical protein
MEKIWLVLIAYYQEVAKATLVCKINTGTFNCIYQAAYAVKLSEAAFIIEN